MAKTKSAGAAKRTTDPNPKNLGVKKFGGETVYPGNIIIRQRGTVYHAGKNVMIGRDHTIFATAEGVVQFRRMTGYKRTQKMVDVVPSE